MTIPYPIAQILATIVEDAASALGVPMAVALADAAGSLIFFGRMDGTLPVSTELAVSKAFTAAVVRMPTHDLGRLAQPGGELYGIQQTHQGRLVLFGGGLPLRLQGRIAGGIGVSGGTVKQDIQAAQSAVTALEEMDQWSDRIRDVSWQGTFRNIPSTHVLRQRLFEELERMHAPPSGTDMDVLVGAVLLAAFRSGVS